LPVYPTIDLILRPMVAWLQITLKSQVEPQVADVGVVLVDFGSGVRVRWLRTLARFEKTRRSRVGFWVRQCL
jgi:hypothetical protein